jgi:hypothetical protein
MTLREITTKSRAVTVLLTALALVGVIIAGAQAASADVSYYGAHGTAGTGASTVSHTFSVWPATTPTTDYDKGQYVSYQIAARDETYSTPGAWKYYSWVGSYVVTRSSTTTCTPKDYDVILGGSGACTWSTTDTSKTGLGSYTIAGAAGHRYGVSVRFAYWVSGGWSYSPFFRAASCINEYVLQGVTFSSRGANCAT